MASLDIKGVEGMHRFFKNDFEGFLTDEQAEYIVEACNNYEPLQTNYNNLLAEYEEICSIAEGQSKIIEKYQKAEIEALTGGE